jgi:hypothetical protein
MQHAVISMCAIYPTHLILCNLTTLITGVPEETLSIVTLRGELCFDVITRENLPDAAREDVGTFP